MYHYNKDGESYLLVDDSTGDILASYSEITILFTEEGTLMKHGSKDRVEKYYRELQKKIPDLVEGYVMFIGHLPVEEINKILDITGYVPTAIRALHQFKPFGVAHA